MATRTIEPNQREGQADSTGLFSSVFSRSLVLNWELIAYVVIFSLAVFTRFYMLGERTMSHDESLHTVFSNTLHNTGFYQHNPMMHGPILFHFTALSYALFGVDDFSSRIYTAVLGVLVVLSPLLMRRWLGRTGAVLAAAMLLLSPLLMYYSRYIRHDMPSILSAILLFWAAMMYISGPERVRRKAYWLYIIAAAMLWNLGSKETAFIYIAIFGLFLTFYWLFRVVQHYFRFDIKLLFYAFNISVLLAGLMALALIVVVTVAFEGIEVRPPLGVEPGTAAYLEWQDDFDTDQNFTLDNTLYARLNYINAQLSDLFSGREVSIPFATFLSWSGLTFVFMMLLVIGTGLWAYRQRSVSFNLLDVAVAVVAFLLALWLADAWSHSTVINADGIAVQTSTSAASLAVGLTAAGVVLLLYATMRILTGRFFTRHLLFVLAIMLSVTLVLLVIEELSHVPSRVATDLPAAQPVPGQGGEVADTGAATDFDEFPILLAWGIAAVAVAGLLYSKAIGIWREVRHFPELDVLIVMGSLILPWLAAFLIVMTNSSATDWTRIGNELTWLSRLLPVATPVQTGQFVIGLLVWLPVALVAVVTGLVWNWRRWIVAAIVFHVLFAFFFTTVFTNVEGLVSGMVYSLQYWLEQQGVKRGSQPQYYYTNIIMPMYEFLPMIGSFLAMLAGLVFFWRRRRQLDETLSPQTQPGGTYALAQSVLGGSARPVDYDLPVASEQPDEVSSVEPADFDQSTPVVIEREAPIREPDVPLDAAAEAEDEQVEAWSPTNLERVQPVRILWPILFLALVAVGAAGLLLVNGLLRPGDTTLIVIVSAVVFVGGVAALIGLYAPVASQYLQAKAQREEDEQFERALRGEPVNEERSSPWRLDNVPFLLFVAWWGILNLVGYTLAGEKMPWLGTHLTVPLILLSGWYFGRVFDSIDWRRFANNGWVLLLLVPLGLVALAQVVLPLLGGEMPFQGTTQMQLQNTYSWIAAALLFTGVVGGVYWLASRWTGWAHVRQMIAVAVFVVLAVLTFRVAWMANFINYDLATEFLVYAHGAPANKDVTDQLRDLSYRITGGSAMRVMHDNRFSWPGSWYLRDFSDNGAVVYIDANTPTQQQLEGVVAVIVGDSNRARVEPLLIDNYQRFDYKRMWWPMQDYFSLAASDINNLMDFGRPAEGLKRRGIFDIWWARDFDRYEQAQRQLIDGYSSDFSLTEWPVSDTMHVYIRKDVAAQVWQFGIGGAEVLNPFTEIQPNVCLENYQQLYANTVFTSAEQPLVRPLGMDVGPDGRIYIANESELASRVSIFSDDGRLLDFFGQPGGPGQEGPFFTRPHSVAVAEDGRIVVADTWNFRIRVFDSDFNYITGWGQPETSGFDVGIEPVDGFWGPRDVAIGPNGRVYVADTGNKRVRVYEMDGTFVQDIGSGGAGDGQLNEPAGIVLHPDGRLFVADTWNQRVAVFDSATGQFLTNYDVRAWADGTGGRPYLALDVERGLLYVTDPDAGRVLVLTVDGECLGSFGQRTEAAPDLSQFGDIGGITVDADGAVYISDMLFSRVLKFDPFPLQEVAPDASPLGEDAASPEVEGTDEVLPDEVGTAE
ncbi:MAG: flippase activity-associated protein Agl23 [Phototrophicaceae bacterium]